MPFFTGYLAVSRPVKQVEPESAAEELLNVRSGPSFNHGIAQRISKGILNRYIIGGHGRVMTTAGKTKRG